MFTKQADFDALIDSAEDAILLLNCLLHETCNKGYKKYGQETVAKLTAALAAAKEKK